MSFIVDTFFALYCEVFQPSLMGVPTVFMLDEVNVSASKSLARPLKVEAATFLPVQKENLVNSAANAPLRAVASVLVAPPIQPVHSTVLAASPSVPVCSVPPSQPAQSTLLPILKETFPAVRVAPSIPPVQSTFGAILNENSVNALPTCAAPARVAPSIQNTNPKLLEILKGTSINVAANVPASCTIPVPIDRPNQPAQSTTTSNKPERVRIMKPEIFRDAMESMIELGKPMPVESLERQLRVLACKENFKVSLEFLQRGWDTFYRACDLAQLLSVDTPHQLLDKLVEASLSHEDGLSELFKTIRIEGKPSMIERFSESVAKAMIPSSGKTEYRVRLERFRSFVEFLGLDRAIFCRQISRIICFSNSSMVIARLMVVFGVFATEAIEYHGEFLRIHKLLEESRNLEDIRPQFPWECWRIRKTVSRLRYKRNVEKRRIEGEGQEEENIGKRIKMNEFEDVEVPIQEITSSADNLLGASGKRGLEVEGEQLLVDSVSAKRSKSNELLSNNEILQSNDTMEDIELTEPAVTQSNVCVTPASTNKRSRTFEESNAHASAVATAGLLIAANNISIDNKQSLHPTPAVNGVNEVTSDMNYCAKGKRRRCDD